MRPAHASGAAGPAIGVAEGDAVEFKEAWTDKALRDLCAFANTRGGTLYVGVRDDGTVTGTAADDAQQRLVANLCDTKLRLTPGVVVERHGDRAVLAVTVRPAARLVRLDGRYYRRVGTASVEMGEDETAARLVAQAGRTWDALAADASLEADVDPEAVRAFVRRAAGRANPRLPAGMRDTDPVDVILGNLDLLAPDGRPTNAAVLLFGRRPQRLVRAAVVRMAAFRSNDDFTAYPDAGGTVFEQIDTTLRQLEAAAPPVLAIGQGAGARAERPPYPPAALREAVTNAVVHRDYLRPGADVEVKLFADRLVVANPGGLLLGITLASLREAPHRSERRNPLVAAALFMDYRVERYGTGTTRIIEACRAAGLPDPEFAADADAFNVTLRRAVPVAERWAAADFTPRQLTALDALHGGEGAGRLTNADYQEWFGVSKATATRELEALTRAGALRKIGTRGVGVHYVLQDVPLPKFATSDDTGPAPGF